MQIELQHWLMDRVDGDRRAFYVSGAETMVTLDGPALRVVRPEQAPVFCPLARIGRVVSRGAVVWDAAALMACARAGIPVIFQLPDSVMCGYLFGWSPTDDALYRCLREQLKKPEGARRYAEWRRVMMERAQSVLGRQLPELAKGNVQERRDRLQQLRRREISAAQDEVLAGRLRALVGALAAELLMEAGIDALRLSRLGKFLLGDLVELLGCALEWPVLKVLQARDQEGASGPDLNEDIELVRFFEGQSGDLRRMGRVVLEQLQKSLEGK